VASHHGQCTGQTDNVKAVPRPADSPAWLRTPELTDRRAEREVLDRLVEAVRAGESRALVVHGEAGVGKTALLELLAGQATGCRVVHVAGVQSEMELAFAGLHQLCAPMLDLLERVPAPQRDALQIAFGMSAGPAPDRFLLGLAVLSLLSDSAEKQPLLCMVDDVQWLDQASAQILAFVARRLGAESVGLVFGVRIPTKELAGLPELVLEGLPDTAARTLLDAVLTGPIDEQVRDQIVAETRGNPLALLELPHGLTAAELAGGFGLPAAPLSSSIEESFRRRTVTLPAETRRLLLLAAADPTGDPALVWRAATRLEISAEAAAPATEAGLAEFGARVRLRHPLARSAAYRSASAQERQEVHRALANATDPQLDPDRRAWHRAQAAPGPDEDVAEELERSADRARARGGLAAAAAFLERAATLTLDPAQRTGRALAAAQAKLQAGAFDAALNLLSIAEAGPVNDLHQALVDLTRAQLAYVTNRGSDAPLLLLKAAKRLGPIDADLSRATYLDALSAAVFAGRLANPGGDVREVACAAVAAPPPQRAPRAPDLLLDGLTGDYNHGYAAELPTIREALATFGDNMSTEEELHWLSWATVAAMRTWDDDHWDALSARHVQLAREAGALGELPLALTLRTYMLLFAGDLQAAASLTDETQAVKDATGSNLAPYGALGLAALRGDETRAAVLLEATKDDVTRRGEGLGITLAEWANAVLHNGLGQYDKAFAAAQRATAYESDLASMVWPAAEVFEAAVRSGGPEDAAATYPRFAEMTTASGTSWALGLQARSHALLSEGNTAERLYREAIAHLEQTRLRVDLARSHLLYGEWLRRQRRNIDARDQLRTAHGMLEAMGVAAYAERARRELRAAGGTVHKRTITTRHHELTAQEAQIAELARDGLSNPEIGTRLFISSRTVQYHLGKVFTKLGITSRSQLDSVLPSAAATAQPLARPPGSR
jgi:DNA-binding CsgD family transcriptional regulator